MKQYFMRFFVLFILAHHNTTRAMQILANEPKIATGCWSGLAFMFNSLSGLEEERCNRVFGETTTFIINELRKETGEVQEARESFLRDLTIIRKLQNVFLHMKEYQEEITVETLLAFYRRVTE